MLSQKRIKQIIMEHKGAFKALEDFETTGKVAVKTRMNFTVDKELARKFREHCRKNRENMSKKIEESIKERLK